MFTIQSINKDSLAQIMAQVVEFGREDYKGSTSVIPDNIEWNIAYQAACFLAQYTVGGDDGVDTEVAYYGLEVNKDMPYEDRLKLAYKLIEEWGGVA